MHIVESTVRNNRKNYRYVRIVQSYRRKKDGLPAQKLIANLGDLSSTATENLKVALAASRQGQRVVMAPQTAKKLGATPVLANLRYLDVAVALSLWRQWRLPQLLQELIRSHGQEAALEDVLAALVIHRCVDPGSKLHAQRWFPTTALPELLGMGPAKFNNTRVHRALSALDDVHTELQQRLAQMYQMRQGVFTALFMDVTDTWFVGQGPGLAEKNRTKEGLCRQRIGIVLLCNERGYPLQWKVIAGKRPDSIAMKEMVHEIAGLDWVRQSPLVCDRSMGQQGGVETLLGHDLHFLTAVPKNEIDGYTDKIPHQRFEDIPLGDTRKSQKVDIRMAARIAEQAGMQKISSTQYVLELGQVQKGEVEAEARLKRQLQQQEGERESVLPNFLQQAEKMKKELDQGKAKSYAELGRRYGYHHTQIRRLVRLVDLPSEIKDAVRSGLAVGVTQRELFDLCKMDDTEQQRMAFKDLLRNKAAKGRRTPKCKAASGQSMQKEEPLSIVVRAVAYFNPEMFVTQRRHANEKLAYINASIADLNQRLSSPNSRRIEVSILGEVSRLLKRDHLEEVFSVHLHKQNENGRMRFFVEANFQQNAWKDRRRYDGFVLLVAHPELCASAAQLAELYRQKDAVEKDFETIKSVLKLRPVRHRTDPKVRAHVDVCMLALLTERTLEFQLAQTECKQTAQSAFEILSTCHLNQEEAVDGLIPLYTVTRCTAEQKLLLSALQLDQLANDEEVAEILTPRC